jgi:transposase
VHLRLSSVTRHDKTYQYAQLVESFRREHDGMPAHRVVANLGRITDPVQLENLQAAFAANRTGERLAPVARAAAEPAATARLRRPLRILRYLDVAVVVELLRQLGLSDELARLLPRAESEVAPDRVVAALVAQRCLDPQSKLKAVSWFPRTALPELLGVAPAQFNNTRVHRVLEQLEGTEQELMRAVNRRRYEQHGRFATLFLDLSDTWFVGEGPELARKGKTKEGLYRKKIGIVLLCDQQGYPLRWEVVEGNASEAPVMLQLMRKVQQVPWLEQTPIVCDRALGRNAHIRELLDAEVPFITALITPEFDSYGVKLPGEQLTELPPPRHRDELELCAAQATAYAKQSSLKQLSENLFYSDLGLVDCPSDETERRATRTTGSEALRIAQALLESTASGKFATLAAAARAVGLSPERGHQYRRLTGLDADLQQQILAGRVDRHSLERVENVARLKTREEQRAAFAELLEKPPPPRSLKAMANAAPPTSEPEEPKRVRCVAYFNPELLARKRWLAQTTLDELQTYVHKLNARLAQPRTRLQASRARHLVEEQLRRHDLLTAFELETESVQIAGRACPQLRLTLDPQQWRRRRSFDGFTVLVAHPKVKLTAKRLCQTYRAKDAVETDFHVIKSLVKVRPVRHRTDVKVRAHVALCMMALTVQRELTMRLKKEGLSAALALEELEPCRLSLYGGRNARNDAYVLPQAREQETRILRRLGLTRLVDERELAAALTPRSEFGPTEDDEAAEK